MDLHPRAAFATQAAATSLSPAALPNTSAPGGLWTVFAPVPSVVGAAAGLLLAWVVRRRMRVGMNRQA
jgi:hypothetical protein